MIQPSPTLLSAIVISLLTITTTACQNNSEGGSSNLKTYEVDIENKLTSISQIFSETQVIKLESENTLIGRIGKLIPRDDFIFISDGNHIFKYNLDGQLLLKFGSKGQGPGEYTQLKSIALGQAEEKVYAASFNKILVYDFDGNLIQEKRFTSFMEDMIPLPKQVAVLKTKYGLPAEDASKKINLTSLTMLNANLDEVDSIIIRSTIVNAGTASTVGNLEFVSNVENQSFIYYPVVYPEKISRDTLFQIKSGILEPALKVDFGISDRMNQNFLITSMVRSKNFILVDFRYKSEAYQCLIDSRSNDVLTVKEGFTDDSYNTGKAKLKIWNANEDQFYFVKDAFELEGIMDDVSIDDNPYIFVVKLIP